MRLTNRKRKELFKLESLIDQRKIESVKKTKSSLLFINYFKSFGTIKPVS